MAQPLGHELIAQPVIEELNPDLADHAPLLRVVDDQYLADNAQWSMDRATRMFMKVVNRTAPNEPESEGARRAQVDIRPVSDKDISSRYTLADGWQPASVQSYEIQDPYQDANPELTRAASSLIRTIITQARTLHGTENPALTYLTSQRGKGGKTMTLITKALAGMDEGVDNWVTHLPDAEQLRPVARPWMDTETITYDEGNGFQRTPMTRALQAVVGGAGDGRAVRGREAWETAVLWGRRQELSEQIQRDGALRITSLGTGTGEPAMDVGSEIVSNIFGEGRYPVVVNGCDINPRSLKVAQYLADLKPGVVFNPLIANLLSVDGIQEALQSTQPHITEAIGFSEYVPSENAPTEIEQKQWELMKRMGCLSAEEWLSTIYQNLPTGSVFKTGQMTNSSPQASFVTDGLGWKGIIQRSTKGYLDIIRNAGIPASAVSLYVPNRAEKSPVYNLLSIVKR